MNPPEEWLIFENTHEAIVDPETWHLAQQTRKTVHRTDTTGVANPLTGLLFCADCGAKMYNHRSRHAAPSEKGRISDTYNCATYTLTLQRETKKCCSHSVSTKAMRELILYTIRTVSEYAIANEEEFQQRVLDASRIKQEAEAKGLKKKLAKAKKRYAELDVLIKKLYESYAMEKISEHRFDMLSAEYEQEQAELESVIAADQVELEIFHADATRADQFMALAKKYTDFSELTTPMINEFIEKILIHTPEKIDGERTMEIEVFLKFIGKFDVPMPEPTPEEIAAAEIDRKRRAANREKYARKKARREQRKLEEQLAQATEGTISVAEEQTV